MKDATHFTWSNAKAAHAVLLCEMERGVLDWSHTSRIERIRRAHALIACDTTQYGDIGSGPLQIRRGSIVDTDTNTCYQESDKKQVQVAGNLIPDDQIFKVSDVTLPVTTNF